MNAAAAVGAAAQRPAPEGARPERGDVARLCRGLVIGVVGQQDHDAVVVLVEYGRLGQDALAGADAHPGVRFDPHQVLLTR
jgi:hypothetical protein